MMWKVFLGLALISALEGGSMSSDFAVVVARALFFVFLILFILFLFLTKPVSK